MILHWLYGNIFLQTWLKMFIFILNSIHQSFQVQLSRPESDFYEIFQNEIWENRQISMKYSRIRYKRIRISRKKWKRQLTAKNQHHYGIQKIFNHIVNITINRNKKCELVRRCDKERVFLSFCQFHSRQLTMESYKFVIYLKTEKCFILWTESKWSNN